MSILTYIRKLFSHKPKSFLDQGKYRVVEAFRLEGITYFQFDSAFELPAGRAMCALSFYEELHMRCTRDYLEKHCRAVEILLSDPKKINIMALAQVHTNLKERLSLAPFPDHIYKLASVTFFDETESPYSYDFSYNQKKIEKWKKAPMAMDFFLRMQIGDLIPFLGLPEGSALSYFSVSEEVNKAHLTKLREILSEKHLRSSTN